ncbi:hypothetical protein BESB_053330 [Besnoitia besnoiti]|uniref:Kinesin motor domain-containing protein n=1 Tax=Besnoitia besnoiti TaxID=94643 RepID=A0A2A9MJW3_BESBE|nr:hypothetical protein BESB_053330 [Besnoitia besnoiti]PFH35682.1 hypothetical protein BESB_053330 [Besnoitia besnoiti]
MRPLRLLSARSDGTSNKSPAAPSSVTYSLTTRRVKCGTSNDHSAGSRSRRSSSSQAHQHNRDVTERAKRRSSAPAAQLDIDHTGDTKCGGYSQTRGEAHDEKCVNHGGVATASDDGLLTSNFADDKSGRRRNVADRRVVVRIRGPSLRTGKSLALCVHPEDNTRVLCHRGTCLQEFRFSRVFSDPDRNDDVYREIGGQRIVEAVGLGIKETILAYGQTGSGKTHSLFGTKKEKGLVQHFIRSLFEHRAKARLQQTISVCATEILGEILYDLLPEWESDRRTGAPLLVRREECFIKTTKFTYKAFTVDDEQGALDLLEEARQQRRVGDSHLNSRSSRSHAIVQFFVHTRVSEERASELLKRPVIPERPIGECAFYGVLTLVDLAGCEREAPSYLPRNLYSSNTAREEMKWGCCSRTLNASISTLNRLIRKMQTGTLDESDRRQSALNRVLFDYLQPECGVCMLFCINPEASELQVSLSTLSIASESRLIPCWRRQYFLPLGPLREYYHETVLYQSTDPITDLVKARHPVMRDSFPPSCDSRRLSSSVVARSAARGDARSLSVPMFRADERHKRATKDGEGAISGERLFPDVSEREEPPSSKFGRGSYSDVSSLSSPTVALGCTEDSAESRDAVSDPWLLKLRTQTSSTTAGAGDVSLQKTSGTQTESTDLVRPVASTCEDQQAEGITLLHDKPVSTPCGSGLFHVSVVNPEALNESLRDAKSLTPQVLHKALTENGSFCQLLGQPLNTNANSALEDVAAAWRSSEQADQQADGAAGNPTMNMFILLPASTSLFLPTHEGRTKPPFCRDECPRKPANAEPRAGSASSPMDGTEGNKLAPLQKTRAHENHSSGPPSRYAETSGGSLGGVLHTEGAAEAAVCHPASVQPGDDWEDPSKQIPSLVGGRSTSSGGSSSTLESSQQARHPSQPPSSAAPPRSLRAAEEATPRSLSAQRLSSRISETAASPSYSLRMLSSLLPTGCRQSAPTPPEAQEAVESLPHGTVRATEADAPHTTVCDSPAERHPALWDERAELKGGLRSRARLPLAATASVSDSGDAWPRVGASERRRHGGAPQSQCPAPRQKNGCWTDLKQSTPPVGSPSQGRSARPERGPRSLQASTTVTHKSPADCAAACEQKGSSDHLVGLAADAPAPGTPCESSNPPPVRCCCLKQRKGLWRLHQLRKEQQRREEQLIQAQIDLIEKQLLALTPQPGLLPQPATTGSSPQSIDACVSSPSVADALLAARQMLLSSPRCLVRPRTSLACPVARCESYYQGNAASAPESAAFSMPPLLLDHSCHLASGCVEQEALSRHFGPPQAHAKEEESKRGATSRNGARCIAVPAPPDESQTQQDPTVAQQAVVACGYEAADSQFPSNPASSFGWLRMDATGAAEEADYCIGVETAAHRRPRSVKAYATETREKWMFVSPPAQCASSLPGRDFTLEGDARHARRAQRESQGTQGASLSQIEAASGGVCQRSRVPTPVGHVDRGSQGSGASPGNGTEKAFGGSKGANPCSAVHASADGIDPHGSGMPRSSPVLRDGKRTLSLSQERLRLRNAQPGHPRDAAAPGSFSSRDFVHRVSLPVNPPFLEQGVEARRSASKSLSSPLAAAELKLKCVGSLRRSTKKSQSSSAAGSVDIQGQS